MCSIGFLCKERKYTWMGRCSQITDDPRSPVDVFGLNAAGMNFVLFCLVISSGLCSKEERGRMGGVWRK